MIRVTRLWIVAVMVAVAPALLAFQAPRTGDVRGTVWLGSGETAAGVRVQLVSAEADDAPGRVLVRAVSSAADGRFAFSQVPPGRYVVGVDIAGRPEGPLVFPATFYPGTPDRAVATVVTVEGGGDEELLPLILPPARTEFTLSGRAVYADGRPAAGASVVLVQGDGDRGELTAPIDADDDGSFSLPVYEGLTYVVRAFYRAYGPGAAAGDSDQFLVTHAPAPVTVVVRPR